MADYPNPLPSGATWLYPAVRVLDYSTLVMSGADGAEQRWPIHAGRESWRLQYRLKTSDKDHLAAFFDSVKGSFDHSWDFTFEGTTYTGCYFESDSFAATERHPGRWTVSVEIRRVRRAPEAGSLPSDFPALSGAIRVQRPWTSGREFDTAAVLTEGARYSNYNRAAARRTWTAGGAVLTRSEAQAIWDFFSLARGRWAEFGFTDPDSLVRYAPCRFGADRIEWHYLGPSHHSIQVQIQQV